MAVSAAQTRAAFFLPMSLVTFTSANLEYRSMARAKKIVYWISTVWLALGMTSSAVVQLMRIPEGVQSVTHLGYPEYLLTILGTWKILGVIAILAPGFRRLKEWAYAGFFFVASGAMTSHLIMRDPFGEVFPSALLLVLTVVSWYLRPDSRKLASAE